MTAPTMGAEQKGAAPFTKVFDQVGDFAATSAAEKWLKENGYSVGGMQRGSPRGIMLGNVDITKWRNLSRRDVAELDGELTGDGRNGPVTVTLKNAPSARMNDSLHPLARIATYLSAVAVETRKATAISVSVPVTRPVARIIATKLREAAAQAFPTDKDLAHDLENVADDFESEAM